MIIKTIKNMHTNLTWQPEGLYQPHFDFEILLNRQFAGEMLAVRITQEAQRRMNELGAKTY